MEAQRSEGLAKGESGVFTYVQYLGKGRRGHSVEERVEDRDIDRAWARAPVGTICLEFFDRAEAVVGGEILRGEQRNRSVGYTRDWREHVLPGDM